MRTPDGAQRRSLRRSRTRRRRAFLLLALALVCAAVAFIVTDVLAVNTHGAQVQHFQIHSARVHLTLSEALVVPPGSDGAGRPLLVFLHGKGGNEDSELNSAFFSALAKLGPRAPDVVFPDGGEDSYWHDRASGSWAAYVMSEVIPQAVTRLHANAGRIAIGGISMGGFGAYDLARLHPRRFCAVGGHSAALWRSGGETFRSADVELARSLRANGHPIELHVWSGAHESAYWNRHLSSYLDFYARALQHCKLR